MKGETNLEMAKRLYCEGVVFVSLLGHNITVSTTNLINTDGEVIYYNGYIIYEQGKWAEIITRYKNYNMKTEKEIKMLIEKNRDSINKLLSVDLPLEIIYFNTSRLSKQNEVLIEQLRELEKIPKL